MLRRFSVFSLALLLCLSLFPARAFASYFSGSASVLWSGFVNDGARYCAYVKGGTNFDAAVAALGYDSSRLSSEVKTKLADENYAGYFYTFAISFDSVTPSTVPSWVPAYVTAGSYISVIWDGISGSEYPYWAAEVASVLYDLALRDFKVVLSGGDLSGGGSSPEPGDVTPPSGFVLWSGGSQSGDLFSLVCIDGSGTAGIEVNMSGVSSYFTGDSRCVGAIKGYSGAFLSFYGFSVPDGVYIVRRVSDDRLFFWNSNSSNASIHYFKTSQKNPSNGVYYPNSESAHYASTLSSGEMKDLVIQFRLTHVNFGDAVVTPPPPSGVWPEPDVPAAPVAPELPEPAEPVVETPVTPTVPAPVWPDITINIDNDPTPGTTPSGLDYTELLTRINDNLISIDSFARAINSNLNSLRSDLLAEFNGVIDSLRNIYNYLLTIDSVLETHCTHLRNKIEQSAVFIANYMRTLIRWLADQLDYDDMTNVDAPDNSLLTTINEKLGGGTYEPNPIKDENGYYEWLDDLWDRFLLGDNWQSSMGNISGSFSELKTRFPFSVPWDIVALFRLFVHDPVTPVFDLPLYFSSDGSTPVHVDLSPWDSVASLVRPMVFVIFALKLALLSRDLLGGLGADKGGL